MPRWEAARGGGSLLSAASHGARVLYRVGGLIPRGGLWSERCGPSAARVRVWDVPREGSRQQRSVNTPLSQPSSASSDRGFLVPNCVVYVFQPGLQSR